jgi:large subunit ribosomal protein L4
MKLDVVKRDNESAGEVDVEDEIFGTEVREHLFWEVVNWQRAKRRQGTHSAKTRSEKRGGGKKPWRQKGVGRARHGSIRSPLWVGGGKAHPPKPKDYDKKISKKKRKAAMRSVLSGRADEGNLRVVEDLELPEIKTKGAIEMLEALDAEDALVVDTTWRDEETGQVMDNEKLRLSVRNLEDVGYLPVDGLNVEDILNHQVLVISRRALEELQEGLKP